MKLHISKDLKLHLLLVRAVVGGCFHQDKTSPFQPPICNCRSLRLDCAFLGQCVKPRLPQAHVNCLNLVVHLDNFDFKQLACNFTCSKIIRVVHLWGQKHQMTTTKATTEQTRNFECLIAIIFVQFCDLMYIILAVGNCPEFMHKFKFA